MEKLEIINQAYRKYLDLNTQIRNVYYESEKYPIFKCEIDEILYYTEVYMREIFMNIAFASGNFSAEEEEFIKKFDIVRRPKSLEGYATENNELESTATRIPRYLKLACEVDKHAGTKYGEGFVNTVKEICTLLHSVDGEASLEESEFTTALIENLEDYLKERETQNEK
ncbi:MAG: hypothetical protein J6M02_06280 [Clostridia bacterium]|nr:hypothetical protein [Clostridia bacterium]